MAKTHYETLGVGVGATAGEIRSAHRRIALLHHPDRSAATDSAAIFIAATEAYAVLSDPDKRAEYDTRLHNEERRTQERKKADEEARARAQTPPPRQEPPKAAPRPIAADVARLSVLFSRGQHGPAETLARQILHQDPRQAVPYAILGDLARSRGNVDEAARLYAYAAQFDPRNPIYQRRYEEILTSSRVVYGSNRHEMVEEEARPIAAYVGGAVLLGLVLVVAMARDGTIANSSWSLILVASLLLGGVTIGVTMALGRLLDRFGGLATTTTGRIGPILALGSVALVNFWFAAGLYVVLGLAQRAFSVSVSRFMFAVGCAAGAFALASAASPKLMPGQVFLWGGNLLYLGALCGWMVTDAFRDLGGGE